MVINLLILNQIMGLTKREHMITFILLRDIQYTIGNPLKATEVSTNCDLYRKI